MVIRVHFRGVAQKQCQHELTPAEAVYGRGKATISKTLVACRHF